MAATTIAPGVTLTRELSRPRRAGCAARGGARRRRGGAAVHAAHAALRQADVGDDDAIAGRSAGSPTRRAAIAIRRRIPETGAPWPPIPEIILQAWRELGGYAQEPEACLINYYAPSARMGLHQDKDEQDFAAPVVSLSLGDTGLFRVGGLKRSDPTRSVRLASGDAVVLGGEGRLAFHGVDRILPNTSTLLPEGGRINLTLRRVDASRSNDSSASHDLSGQFSDHSLGVIHPSELPALSLTIAMRPTPGTSHGSRTTSPPSLVARASAVDRSVTAT